MAELIAVGTTLADSGDFTVTAGAPKALYIKYAGGMGAERMQFLLQHKSADLTYSTVVQLDATNIALLGNVTGAGTFRVRRLAGPAPVGMEIE